MRPHSYYAICAIGLLLLIGGEAPAQEKTAEAKLPLHERVWIAAQIYSAILGERTMPNYSFRHARSGSDRLTASTAPLKLWTSPLPSPIVS